MQIKDLSPNPDNPRQASKEKLSLLKKSLEEFGDLSGFVFNRKTKNLVGGHQRAKLFKRDAKVTIEKKYSKPTRTGTVAEGFVEFHGERFTYREVAWNLNKEKAGNIAANKGAGEWDLPKLSTWMQELQASGFNLDLTMFDESERGALLDVEKIEGKCDEDEVPAAPKKAKTVLGDIYKLGRHRLMCGDSTSIDAVEKLMNGSRADFGFCDPPYNLGFRYNDYDDSKSDVEYIEFSKLWFSNLQMHTDRQCITLGTKNIPIMSALDSPAGVACWIKKNWITSCKISNLQQWEPIFFYGDYKQLKRSSDLFEINRVVQKDVGNNHTCPKQIALIEDILEHYSLAKVVDLFGGSGTTMIASEKIGRSSYLMELDPIYCDVIVKRWEEYTGKKAELLRNNRSSKKTNGK